MLAKFSLRSKIGESISSSQSWDNTADIRFKERLRERIREIQEGDMGKREELGQTIVALLQHA